MATDYIPGIRRRDRSVVMSDRIDGEESSVESGVEEQVCLTKTKDALARLIKSCALIEMSGE